MPPHETSRKCGQSSLDLGLLLGGPLGHKCGLSRGSVAAHFSLLKLSREATVFSFWAALTPVFCARRKRDVVSLLRERASFKLTHVAQHTFNQNKQRSQRTQTHTERAKHHQQTLTSHLPRFRKLANRKGRYGPSAGTARTSSSGSVDADSTLRSPSCSRKQARLGVQLQPKPSHPSLQPLAQIPFPDSFDPQPMQIRHCTETTNHPEALPHLPDPDLNLPPAARDSATASPHSCQKQSHGCAKTAKSPTMRTRRPHGKIANGAAGH